NLFLLKGFEGLGAHADYRVTINVPHLQNVSSKMIHLVLRDLNDFFACVFQARNHQFPLLRIPNYLQTDHAKVCTYGHHHIAVVDWKIGFANLLSGMENQRRITLILAEYME